ncbi:MAG: hypothetical protein IJG63_05320 [Oscillospiraceae bacterium]|nr:hypothetical protein [Oscillospiraceae bacterium]
MTGLLDANISQFYYFTREGIKDKAEFHALVSAAFPDAERYDPAEKSDDPYITDMQTAQRFLHGGGQPYEVCRYFLRHLHMDGQKSGVSGFAALLCFCPVLDVLCVSFHFGLRDKSVDQLITLRQSGRFKAYSFDEGEFSCEELAKSICAALKTEFDPVELSYTCELTKFGDYDNIADIEENEANTMYGLITGDEGYMFVPRELVDDRLSCSWGSRDFIKIFAFGQAFLFLNLIDCPSRQEYLKRQVEYGAAAYGGADDYFFMGSCPLTVNHGIFFSVEFTMVLKTIIDDVIEYQGTYESRKGNFYQRIKATRSFRRKIIMVLERVERIGISEIGQLNAMLMESQHISPIVDRVKYLLELLESDLDLMYSERNNFLVTILTIIGLIFAALQIVLPFI